MRGLDTNVLLRVLTDDDRVQSAVARRILEDAEARGEPFYLATNVLCEVVWALRDGAYRQGREDIASALAALLESAVFEVQDRDLVRRAIEDYRAGPGDFADYLIGWQNHIAGCDTTLTFDRALATCERFSLFPR